jgi:hypothetical protein
VSALNVDFIGRMLCVSTFTNDSDKIIDEKIILKSIGLLRICFLSVCKMPVCLAYPQLDFLVTFEVSKMEMGMLDTKQFKV